MKSFHNDSSIIFSFLRLRLHYCLNHRKKIFNETQDSTRAASHHPLKPQNIPQKGSKNFSLYRRKRKMFLFSFSFGKKKTFNKRRGKLSIISFCNARCMVTSEKMKSFPFPRAHKIFRKMFSSHFFRQCVSICYQQGKNRWQHLALLNWKGNFSLRLSMRFFCYFSYFRR